MSFVISIYVKEGIVLASDSRTTFSAVQTIQPQKEGDAPSVVNHLGVHISDTNYKSFVTSNHVGITTCGDASIKGQPITGYIEAFIREYDTADVETIANALLPYFKRIEPGLKSIFTVAGYKYVKENQYEQKVFVINTQKGKVESLNTTAQGALIGMERQMFLLGLFSRFILNKGMAYIKNCRSITSHGTFSHYRMLLNLPNLQQKLLLTL